MLYKKAGNKVQLVLTDILLSFGSIGVSKLRMFFFWDLSFKCDSDKVLTLKGVLSFTTKMVLG